jgi:dolichol-phosphate mannosyltransferase
MVRLHNFPASKNKGESNKMLASVIIPVKNEPYLPTLLGQLGDYEVLVQREPGLANAVLHGVKLSHGEAIVTMDADGSHNPKYVPEMLKYLSVFDVVVGSRYVKGGGTEDYFVRMLLSRLFCKLARFILHININDCMSGFIVARREVYEQLKLKPFGYKFGLDIIVQSKGRFKVAEYPVFFVKRKMGLSKTGFGQGIRTLAFIIKLRLEHI